MLRLSKDETKKMSREDLENEIINYTYSQMLIFETLEHFGILRGNGHHMAQEMAEKAKEIFNNHYKNK
uniref:Uncharacterized protein n=1 Tax=viral metagenome TaxID=1070528 RepID=A0A6H1ZCC3_9ZZZZ